MTTALRDVTIDDLRDAVEAADDTPISTVLMNLVATVSAGPDDRTIARTRAVLERLRTSPIGTDYDAQLGQAVDALALALTRRRLATADERATRAAGELSEEIRAALADEPARPKDLIARTGADPAQVARVLTKLVDAGAIERVPSVTADGRERWYGLRQAATADIATLGPRDITAQLKAIAPVKELRARGFIADTSDVLRLATDVATLYRVGNLFEVPSFALAARRSKTATEMTAAQTAWVAVVRHLGESAPVADYDCHALAELARELPRRLEGGSGEVTKIAEWLAECGVAFVVEPGFTGAKLDGVAVIGANGSRIVGLSVRLDRFDSFLFTLLHELAHILNGDLDTAEQICVDATISDGPGTPEQERAANALAVQLLFPDGLEIPARVTSQWIAHAAREAHVHPSVVIGHVQHRREDWTTMRGNVIKVRHEFGGAW